ncbi:MAG: DUF547 domain-containing protein [Bacteroidia bacterium]|nr:DUF547 domain-containing protein [Bacteroidia bacterium]
MKKYLVLFVFTFALIACCGAKEVVDSQSKLTEEIVAITVPEVPDPTILEQPNKPEIEKEIDIAEAFDHSVLNDLLQKYVSVQGNVNYNGFKSDRIALRNYISSLGENMPLNSWSKEDKLAYWINAYNALTIDLILRNPSVKSIKDIKDTWDQRLWNFGEKRYSLNQIEHEILRKMNEPRIHFAIVCASVSCPKLQNEAFTASNLEIHLTNSTKEFLSDSSKNKLSRNSVKLSKIFKWFAKDFKHNQSLIDFLNKYSNIQISQNASKSYMDYNWDLND